MRRPENEGFPNSQLVRHYPSAYGLNSHRPKVDDLTDKYIKFVGSAITPPETVDEVVKLAKKKGYGNKPSKKKPFYILGPDEKSFALISPGKKPIEQGIRVVASHTDSPCLVIRQRPLDFEWDPDEKELQPGVLFTTHIYGGIHNYQWHGKQLSLRLFTIKNRKRIKQVRDAYINGPSAHLSRGEVEEGNDPEILRVFAGHKSRREALKDLGFKYEEDFFRSAGYVVPNSEPMRIKKDFIIAYGHDDRAGTFAAVDAILGARKNYTSAVI
ncbi:hypothetical protein ACFLZ7_03865, partial [Nanoarchaeota archaeon]